jgi:hypothetical protein
VEQAKAELAAMHGQTEAPALPPSAFDWPPVGAEPSAAAIAERYDQRERDLIAAGPPTIVMEDADGHVELVRIFDTLSRVDCADQAVLLNYAPHSVTVGITAKTLPDPNALAAAVREVFERSCEVKSQDNRITVQLGGRRERVA